MKVRKVVERANLHQSEVSIKMLKGRKRENGGKMGKDGKRGNSTNMREQGFGQKREGEKCGHLEFPKGGRKKRVRSKRLKRTS